LENSPERLRINIVAADKIRPAPQFVYPHDLHHSHPPLLLLSQGNWGIFVVTRLETPSPSTYQHQRTGPSYYYLSIVNHHPLIIHHRDFLSAAAMSHPSNGIIDLYNSGDESVGSDVEEVVQWDKGLSTFMTAVTILSGRKYNSIANSLKTNTMKSKPIESRESLREGVCLIFFDFVKNGESISAITG
jgi:hypothetical protein